MMLAFVLPVALAGEKTVTISRNEGIYDDGTGVYYCTKGGITMTFSSGLNNVNYLVEHQQVVFDIFSTNYVIKKIKFNCLDNTTNDNLDCFYWGPSTIHECERSPYVPTGTYTWSGYIGTWVGGSTPSKYVKFETEAKPVRFGSVEITYDKEFGDIFDLVRFNTEIQNGQTYALVSKYDSRALGKEEFHGDDPVMTFSSTPVTLLNFDETLNNYLKVKVTDEVSLMKLESSGNSDRPWYIKIGDNYLRRRTGNMQGSGGPGSGQGWNIYTVSNIPNGSESYFRTRITVENNNNNALIRYAHTSSETSNGETFAIRHYNGGDLFRVIDYNTSNNSYANNQRVYLYKPAEPYIITTDCLPDDNSGYITLGDGVLLDNQGNQTSQYGDNVSFFVGPTEGWGIGDVTVTNLSTNEVTTLTPTNTSDFGNDYQFPMPAADVNITANFLPPYNIDTICDPTDGGIFNFISGSTDFNGEHKSNEGKTVTFQPIAADGYTLSSVTYEDNVTGETITLTPDADGVYSFVMPGNDVTLTAHFEAAHDLYLLGTANGEISWHPYGPQFTFDGASQKYYIDVYFKGGTDSNADPAYGYFSLTKKIGDTWEEISGSRLFANTYDDSYWVEDGNTYYDCFQTSYDRAFRIKPGVYRIEVNQELTQMTIIEYPLTLTFDPAGGVHGNGTLVDPNTEVTISSNLQDLVHAINPNEDPVLFYNTIDNWATQENDNTRVITNVGETTVTASATLGYITVPGQAVYEILGDLYLLGTANGRSKWVPYGPQFTYDADADEYYIDVYFKGYNDDANADDGYGYFSLSTKIGSNDDDWSSINGYRLFANADGDSYWVEEGEYNDCFQTHTDKAFRIPAGVYRITVNRAKTKMTITEYPLTLTFDPASGSTVASGDPVNISSNLNGLVHAINPDEEDATFMYATSLDGTLPTPNVEGSTVTITETGATTTVNAQANIGYIIAKGNANYMIPAPAVYNIYTQVNPEGSNAGTIEAPTSAAAGSTVDFTVTDTDASVYTLTGVEVVDRNNVIVVSLEPSQDGNYSFTMPSDDVTIHADYERTKYNVTTSWSPSEGGEIWMNGINTPQTVSVANGSDVVFGVLTADGYELSSIVVTNETTGETIEPRTSGSNEYTFVMPCGNVSVTAYFASPLYKIEDDGVVGESYTIADQLVGVFAFDNSLWCKDQGNISLAKTEPNEGQIDFLMMIEATQREGGWDQSNWVELILDNNQQASDGVGKLIKASTVRGKLTDKLNYKMEVENAPLQFDGVSPYIPNTYCTVNFLEDNLTLTADATGAISQTNGKSYYFLNPKIQEYAAVTFAMWDESQQIFVIPAQNGYSENGNNFDGAIRLDPSNGWHYNMYGDIRAELDLPENANNVYYFHILVQRDDYSYGPSSGSGPSNGPKRESIKPDQTASETIKVYPLDLKVDASHIVTAVNEIRPSGEIQSVEYFNAMGVRSETPFDGINIVVTRYTDGSISTTKVLR